VGTTIHRFIQHYALTLRHFNSVSPSAVGVNTTHPDRQDNADVQKGLGRLIQLYMVGRQVDGQQKNPHQNITPDKVFIKTIHIGIKPLNKQRLAEPTGISFSFAPI